MKGWIGITLGDLTGIGPEVTLKAVAAESPNDDTKFLFIGDEKNLRQLNSSLGLNLPLKTFSNYNDSGKFFITNPSERGQLVRESSLPENLPAGSPLAANLAIAALRDGGQRCLRGELDARRAGN